MQLMKLLVFIDSYLPGFRSGGPIRSMAGLAAAMKGDYDMRIVTRHCDWPDNQPYDAVPANRWVAREDARVWYADRITLRMVRSRAREVAPDLIVLNSFFSRLSIRVLVLRRLGLIPFCPLLMVPRGEFAPAALAVRSTRKKIWMRLARVTNLLLGVTFVGASRLERANIGTHLGQESLSIAVVPEVGVEIAAPAQRLRKEPGTARLVTLGRVSRIKNLLYIVQVLQRVRGRIQFDVYGPMEDPVYWRECEAAAGGSETCAIRYRGELPHERITEAFQDAHWFVSATLAESFGHSIVESMLSACPAVISDRTQWRGLAGKNAGYDVPLEDPSLWVTTLQKAVDMGNDEYQAVCRNAREYGLSIFAGTQARPDWHAAVRLAFLSSESN